MIVPYLDLNPSWVEPSKEYPGIWPTTTDGIISGNDFPARKRNNSRPLIDMASVSLPKSPVSSSPGNEVLSHVYVKAACSARNIFGQLGERTLQQYLPIADMIRTRIKPRDGYNI